VRVSLYVCLVKPTRLSDKLGTCLSLARPLIESQVVAETRLTAGEGSREASTPSMIMLDLLPPIGEDGEFVLLVEDPPNEEGTRPVNQIRQVVTSLREEEDTAPLVAAARVDQGSSGDSD